MLVSDQQFDEYIYSLMSAEMRDSVSKWSGEIIYLLWAGKG
jgi:hypothetical protein